MLDSPRLSFRGADDPYPGCQSKHMGLALSNPPTLSFSNREKGMAAQERLCSPTEIVCRKHIMQQMMEAGSWQRTVNDVRASIYLLHAVR